MSPTAPVAVTFDYWNTLIREEPGMTRGLRLDAWAGILEDAGFAAERQKLDHVYNVSWQRFVKRWTANEQYQAVQVAEDILDDLGYDLPSAVRDALVEAFVGAGLDADLKLTDSIGECLAVLHSAGVRLGIICDVGYTGSATLRAHLDRHGILDLFDYWSFSDEVGAYKPSSVIFQHALDGLEAKPNDVAHVGDLRRTDVAGALAMGMTAVRYIGVNDDKSVDEPEAHHVVADHADLPAVLGV